MDAPFPFGGGYMTTMAHCDAVGRGIHAINRDWYFLTREGQNIGPFPNKKAAEDSLAELLKTVKKDE